MKDYIIFKVGINYYALEVERVERIIQVPQITYIPSTHPFIDGMMSYEKRVTKVVSFRQMTNVSTYETELKDLFAKVENDHSLWVKTLRESIQTGQPFSLTTNPHQCKFGQWLDSFSTHDIDVLNILKVLRPVHAKLHEIGKEALVIREKDPQKALEYIDNEMETIYSTTINEIHKISDLSSLIANNIQKLLIYRSDESFFAIKVDSIEDIAQIALDEVQAIDSNVQIGTFLEIEGVIEMGEKLINVIKSITLPNKEVA